MKGYTLLSENFKISFQAIRTNTLRTILTIFIIAFGIMALVGILTAIDSIKSTISSQFEMMGANTFTIQSRGLNIQIGGSSERRKNYSYISYTQAEEFKERFTFPALVSISVRATGTATVKQGSEKTNPNISVIGADENYLTTAGYEIRAGRNLSEQDVSMNRNSAVVGQGVIDKVFEKNEDPIGKVINIGSGKYKIIGILEEKGASFGGAGDNVCILPVSNVRQYFSRPNMSFSINVSPFDGKLLDAATGEAEGVFRIVRNLDAVDETDFNINKSDSLVETLLENIKYVTLAATIIGIITLFGAAVGLMNIMLVSVSERTREIGTRKAIGAKAQTIKQQFLFEAVMIGQLGGILGIVLGILIGNVMSLITKGPFVVPWLWITIGVVLCLIVGLVSGLWPAVKASRLDPIEALRYE